MYLFPNRMKKISGLIFYSSSIIGLSYLFFYDQISELTKVFTLKVPTFISFNTQMSNSIWESNNILDELLTILIITSGLIHGFSKEKVEDELIAKIRLESLAWSIKVNFLFILIETLFIFGIYFYNVMIIQLFSILIIFNIKNHFSMSRFYNQRDEK